MHSWHPFLLLFQTLHASRIELWTVPSSFLGFFAIRDSSDSVGNGLRVSESSSRSPFVCLVIRGFSLFFFYLK